MFHYESHNKNAGPIDKKSAFLEVMTRHSTNNRPSPLPRMPRFIDILAKIFHKKQWSLSWYQLSEMLKCSLFCVTGILWSSLWSSVLNNVYFVQLPITHDHSVKINTLGPRQNGRHFPDKTAKCIFLNENARISITISLKFVSSDPMNNIPALVQIMDWRCPGDKPLSEPMMVSVLMHLCITRPQWVKKNAIRTNVFDNFLLSVLFVVPSVEISLLLQLWRVLDFELGRVFQIKMMYIIKGVDCVSCLHHDQYADGSVGCVDGIVKLFWQGGSGN